MALLNRLFPSRRKQPSQKGYVLPATSYANRDPFNFSKDQVRILLLRECERRGRKLLFDSRAVRKIVLPTPLQCGKARKGVKTEEVKRPETFVEITNGFGYQYTRPSADVKALGEMIFGSVAMAFRGSTFKVHIGGSPPVLMLTKVTNSPSKRDSDRGLEDSYGSSINSMNEYYAGGSSSDSKLSGSGSCPLDVPLPTNLTPGTCQFLGRGDKSGCPSGLEGDSDSYTNCDVSMTGTQRSYSFNAALSSPDSRKGSGGSLSSLRRRWLRTASTSLDFDSNQSLTQTESLVSCSSLPNCGDEKHVRRTKLGIAVIISLTYHQKESMQEFFLEHAALLESIAVRLHATVERAYHRNESFVSMMYDASCDVEQCVEDLLLGPRLTMPVWLGLLSYPSQLSTIASSFMQELGQAIEEFDTKDTNFFLSTLVTAVLTHHLGWVPTVTPGVNSSLRQPGFDMATRPFSLSDLSKSHPYNPLWAQAMDLYGALGHPLKTSRTIIMSTAAGKNRVESLERLLRITSYFIRCAAIDRVEPRLEDFDFQSVVNMGQPGNKMDSIQMSSDDRTSSSSTLRPVSGKCSPLLHCYQTSTADKTNELTFCHPKDQRVFGMVDLSSKSENCLDVRDASFDLSCKLKPNVGLRRTMSYSSKITYSAIAESQTHENMESQSNSNSIKRNGIVSSKYRTDRAQILAQDKSDCKCLIQNISQESHPTADKVVFVLGEDENLVGLKGKRKGSHEAPENDNKTTLEGKEKQLEQPLSFSGSEVESGFSECESFELSPVRSLYANFPYCKDCSADNFTSHNQCVEPRLCSSRNDENTGNVGTCSRNILRTDQTSPLRNTNPRILLPPAVAFGQNGGKSRLFVMESTNFRSLSRSLSVNLPICLKTIKCESCANDQGENDRIVCKDTDRKENVHPVVGSLSCSKKGMKKLRRAHSLFCVKTSLKNFSLCQNCDLNQENLKIVEDNTHQHCAKEENHKLCVQSVENLPKEFRFIELSLPVSQAQHESSGTGSEWGVAGSLFGGVSSHYIPERVLQGCAPLGPGWEVFLKRDLALEAQQPTLDPGLSEAVAIVANIDSCDVQLISSHTYVVDRPGTLGVRAGLSQLVANMLESVNHMWRSHLPPDLCLSFLENRLQEILLRSQALSELLLTTEFCDMDNLTSTLALEPNDVPLLMSVASTHSPEVTQRYGLSFR